MISESAASPDALDDVRPVIPTGSQSNWGLWAFLALLVIGGLVLFNALSASEDAAQAPSVFRPADGGSDVITSPPPLGVPDRFGPRRVLQEAEVVEGRALPARTIVRTLPSPGIAQPYIPPPPPQSPAVLPPPEPVRPQVVFEQRSPPAAATPAIESAADRARVTAGRFLNPARTIPQGTVIPAVLETALDSTRAGGVRALVQRDISGFDGSRILIPRGSRLYGEYEANLQPGENRALVQWTRLIRPDGVTIALDSPSSDPLGRAGVKGKVDTKFLQRFGGAILQSVLDIGVGIAVNRATDGVIVALPGSTQNVRVTEPNQIQPTLKVRHGTSVSVFVARDLDFSTVES